jgi:hypothetical protein
MRKTKMPKIELRRWIPGICFALDGRIIVATTVAAKKLAYDTNHVIVCMISGTSMRG